MNTATLYKLPWAKSRICVDSLVRIVRGVSLLSLGIYTSFSLASASSELLQSDRDRGLQPDPLINLSVTPPSSDRSTASRTSSHGRSVHLLEEGRVIAMLPTYSALITEAEQKAFVTNTLRTMTDPVGVSYRIGLELLEGSARVTKQPAQARLWLAYANDEKHPGAANLLYQLGLLYLDGRGIERDFPLAKKLFVSAASGGCADALIMLDLDDDLGALLRG